MSDDARHTTGSRATGRRAGNSGTRDAILAAARSHFALDGYAASLRAVAATADVDVALIRHFFGSKDDLFTAILALPDEAPQRLLDALAGDPETLGERLARAYLALWEEPATAEPLIALARTALASRHTTDHVRELVTRRLLSQVFPKLEVDRPEARFALVSAQLMGVALARYVLRAGPLAELESDTIASLLGPTIQLQLTGKV